MSSIEEIVRQIVREEMAKLGGTPTRLERVDPLLLTVPQAAKLTGISVDTLRLWINEGRLPYRSKSGVANPKRPTFLVNLDEVKAASEGRRVAR